MDGLYLKLDKKLIFKVDKLTIPHIKRGNTVPDFDKNLDRINKILKFFEYISLKKIEFKNDIYTFLYTDHILYLTNNEFEVAAHNISRVGKELQAIIDLIYIKKYDVRLSGKLVYNYKNDIALIHGDAQYRDIKIEYVVNKNKNNFYYVTKSNRFTQLKPLVEQFDLPPKINEWIVENIKADGYTLNSLKGMGKIEESGVNLMPKTIMAKATLDNAIIKFQKDIPPVLSKELNIRFEDGDLLFDIDSPSFENISLAGSRVSIVKLAELKPTLKLNLLFESRFDSRVESILKSYNIELPIKQRGGKIKTDLKIDVDLLKKSLSFGGDFNISKSTISIGGVEFPVDGGDLHIEDGVVYLKNIALKNHTIDAVANGKIYLKDSKAAIKLKINRLHLGGKKDGLLSIKDRVVPIDIVYKKGVKITLPTYLASMNISDVDKSATIKLRDLKRIKKSIKSLPISIVGGSLSLETKDYDKYNFSGILKRDDCFFYENNDSVCLTQIPIGGSFSKEYLILKALNGRFVLDTKKSIVNLNRLNIDLKKYFEVEDKNRTKTDGQVVAKKMKVIAKKSLLRYGTHRLLTDKYQLGILPNGNFHFRGTLDRDLITVTKNSKQLEIVANRIEDKMLHPLINFAGLQGGRYTVKISGVVGKKMRGVIRLDGGLMSDFKAYNNVLALINTVPALATLSSPGFNSKGFKIEQGIVKFTMIKGTKLIFDSVFIEGKSATISGDGVIDLDTKKIDVDLAIQTAKPIDKFISSIPVVGYIIAGDDESIMTVGLHIGGTLDRPETKTSTIKDVLMLPFNLIKRTIVGKKKNP
ncbi:Putative periplasmic protein [hydrothermal vent metagenome]|uniref:Putative periplasmic protein n=1 Tax=hydrothermal vent metagenome TaxID=652676 RepID=A0A1W1B8U8_9ZZZZ